MFGLGNKEAKAMITLKMLKQMDACEKEVTQFKETFEHKVDVTPDIFDKYAPNFSTGWMLFRMLQRTQNDKGCFCKSCAQNNYGMSHKDLFIKTLKDYNKWIATHANI